MSPANFPELSSPFSKSALRFHFCTMLFWSSVYVYMPILAPYAQKIGGSLQAVGLVMGAYGFSQFLLRIPIGLWSDRLRKRKPFILLGFFFDLIASLGLIFSTTTWMLFLSFFTAGIAASMWVVFTVLFSSYFPLGQVAQSMSLILFSNRLSQIISNYVGGAIAEAWGWGAPFYAGAVFSILGLILATGIAERQPEGGPPISWGTIWSVGRNPQLRTVSLFGALLQFVIFSTAIGFTPIYAQRVGASKGDLGVLLFSFTLPSTLASLLSGTYARRLLPERSLIVGGFLLMAIAILFTPLVSHLGFLYAIQAINGVGVGLTFPLLMTLAIQPIAMEQQGTAMGIFQALYAVGMSLGPVISGLIGSHLGLTSVFILSGILCLLSAVYSWKKVRAAHLDP